MKTHFPVDRPTAEHSSQTFSLDGCKNVSLVFQVFNPICQHRMKDESAEKKSEKETHHER